jgi:hypothetical protein
LAIQALNRGIRNRHWQNPVPQNASQQPCRGRTCPVMGTSDGSSGEGDTTRITSPGARVGSAASPAYTEDSARGVSYGSTREALLGGSESMYLRAAMETLRIGRLGFGTGRQRMVLERWTNPKLSRRACTCEYGLQSCRGKSAGVAKWPRERFHTRKP